MHIGGYMGGPPRMGWERAYGGRGGDFRGQTDYENMFRYAKSVCVYQNEYVRKSKHD